MKKKISSLFLTLILTLTVAFSAMAATVTVPEGILEGHSYEAYQVLTGTQGENDSALGNAAWGAGIDSAGFLTALKANSVTASAFADCETALEFATALGTVESNSAIANEIAKVAYDYKQGNGTPLATGENELAPGYYLIVDVTEIGEDEDAVYNAALLQVTEDIEISVKTDKPAVEKKVKENSSKYDGDSGYGAGYNDVADYHIGDTVPFAFYSDAPDMTYFDTYQYVFHDVMSDGLTFDSDSVKVTIGGQALAAEQYTIEQNPTDGCTFEIVIADLKTIADKGDAIRVDFTATLNENAEIGLPGNPNKVCLEYSNNPNVETATGKTTWDEVIVFTYELDVTKVDGKDKAVTLQDAEFKLRNEAGKWALVDIDAKVTGWADTEEEGSVLTSDENGFFQVTGLDDGVYYLKETKAPLGYNILTKEMILTVDAATNNGHTWTDGLPESALTELAIQVQIEDETETTTNTGDVKTGIVAVSVLNNKGAFLPETGGVGTVMFYITGGLLLVGALGIWVMRRRVQIG